MEVSHIYILPKYHIYPRVAPRERLEGTSPCATMLRPPPDPSPPPEGGAGQVRAAAKEARGGVVLLRPGGKG